MKIVCESCGAKYSIADERVSGKVFKIRCKRCSEVIVVRGDQPAPVAEAPAAFATPAQDVIWHVVVDGEQAGPYSPGQLGEMLTSGAVDWDAYVWTEGFDNWAPMRDVADLVAQITGQPQAQAAAQAAPAYRPPTQTLTGQPSMGADPFADDAAPSDAGLFGGAAAAAGPDLFARGAAQPALGGYEDRGVVASSPSPRVATEHAMTGARNENSVLFSLKNLQALATGSGSSGAPPPAAAATGGERAGFASGEGSGLIDIRALATTTGISEGGEPSAHKDELLSMGSHGGAFGTLGSPMLTTAADDSDGHKKTIIWAVVAGVGLVCTAGVLAAYILRGPASAAVPPAVGVVPQPVAPAAAPVQTAAAAPAAPAPAPSEGELAAKKAAAEEASAEEKNDSHGSSSEHHHRHSSESSSAKASHSEAPAPAAPEKKAPPKPTGPRTIDDLLEGALNGSSSKTAAKSESAAAKPDLPETPSRDQVRSAMSSVQSAVQACSSGSGGVAIVTVNVAGATGRVTNAEVSGVTGPAGSCIAKAVRKARFPKFSSRVFKIAFPYKL